MLILNLCIPDRPGAYLNPLILETLIQKSSLVYQFFEKKMKWELLYIDLINNKHAD